jgi:hypothetical protein
MTPAPDGDQLWCQFCGLARDDPDGLRRAKELFGGAREYDPPGRDYDMPETYRLRLDTAWKSIQEGDPRTAEHILRDTLFLYPTSADAWYLLSLMTADHGEKLLYLDRALDAQPYHEYAWRDKGALLGVIPAEQAPDLADAPDPDAPIEAESETHACPQCGGALAFEAGIGALVCAHCGFRPGAAVGAGGARTGAVRGGFDDLDNALLQRRFGFSREWKIGARVLVCQNCGAQLTLAGTALSTQCPFCDSAHVLIQDAVGSFEEPDALLPFKLDRGAAAKAVHRLAREAGLSIERGEMLGVYLPFWSFQGMAAVTTGENLLAAGVMRLGVFDVGEMLVSGATQPGQAAQYEMMPYDLRALVPYDPRTLARWQAQIYRIDVIQASLTARAYAKYVARRMAADRHFAPPEIELARADSTAYNPPDTPFWRSARVEIEALRYRLLLLPAWMVTLILDNGARRPAIVNGQTGEAILAASFARPETIIAGPGRPPVEPLPLEPPRRAVIRPLDPAAVRPHVIRPLDPAAIRRRA